MSNSRLTLTILESVTSTAGEVSVEEVRPRIGWHWLLAMAYEPLPPLGRCEEVLLRAHSPQVWGPGPVVTLQAAKAASSSKSSSSTACGPLPGPSGKADASALFRSN